MTSKGYNLYDITKLMHDLNYHCVFIPFRRKKVFRREQAAYMKKIVYEICERRGWRVISMEIDIDHVHLFISLPQTVPPNKMFETIKSVTALELRKRYPEYFKQYFYRKRNGKYPFWARSFFVRSAGEASSIKIKHYIERYGHGLTSNPYESDDEWIQSQS